jgi:hypothetical protein
MAGEFVRTPKQGVNKGRYRARADLPLFETALSTLSFASVVASLQTHHYFATPFAALFTIGYAYVAVLVIREQAARRREAVRPALSATEPAFAEAPISEPPPASGEQWVAEPSRAADFAA